MSAYAKKFPIRIAAKEIGVRPKRLFSFLREQHFIDNNNVAYPQYIEQGYFKIQNRTWRHPETEERQYYQCTFITVIGIDFLKKQIEINETHEH